MHTVCVYHITNSILSKRISFQPEADIPEVYLYFNTQIGTLLQSVMMQYMHCTYIWNLSCIVLNVHTDTGPNA